MVAILAYIGRRYIKLVIIAVINNYTLLQSYINLQFMLLTFNFHVKYQINIIFENLFYS